jgi:hypothetical protein
MSDGIPRRMGYHVGFDTIPHRSQEYWAVGDTSRSPSTRPSQTCASHCRTRSGSLGRPRPRGPAHLCTSELAVRATELLITGNKGTQGDSGAPSQSWHAAAMARGRCECACRAARRTAYEACCSFRKSTKRAGYAPTNVPTTRFGTGRSANGGLKGTGPRAIGAAPARLKVIDPRTFPSLCTTNSNAEPKVGSAVRAGLAWHHGAGHETVRAHVWGRNRVAHRLRRGGRRIALAGRLARRLGPPETAA